MEAENKGLLNSLGALQTKVTIDPKAVITLVTGLAILAVVVLLSYKLIQRL